MTELIETVAEPPAPPRTAQGVWPVAAGMALGAFAVLADRSIVTTTLGQMVTPWVLLAALAGYHSARGLRWAAIAGAVALTVANATYHSASLALHGVHTPRYWLLWTAVGLAVGPAAAGAGWVMRHGIGRLRLLGAAALAAVPPAESVVLWGHIDRPEAHLTYILVGALGLGLVVLATLPAGRRTMAEVTALAGVLAVPAAILFEVGFSRLGIV